MDEIRFESMATERRFHRLREYCEQEAFIDPDNFRCRSVDACTGSLPVGSHLVRGGLAFVGVDYDIRFGDRELRLLFVGIDRGNQPGSLIRLREDIQEYPGKLNCHYRGIVKVLMEVFQVTCVAEKDEGRWKPLLRRMAQTNLTRCCAPKHGKMRTNQTATMVNNCWAHFKKELEVLQPTVILFHGKRLLRPFLESLRIERLVPSPLTAESKGLCYEVAWSNFERPFCSTLLFFNHPSPPYSPYNFGSQWESKVLPMIAKLRDLGHVPNSDASWKPRGRKAWPSL
jgi:hypothetical protein